MIKIIIAFWVMLLVVGCSKAPPASPQLTTPTPSDSPPAQNTCTTNNDCVRTGCSGTICQSQKQEPVFSTCEYKAGYECYNDVPCGCVEGSCQWSNEAPYTGVLQKCLAEKKGQAVDDQGVPIV
ncbi:MAG: eight-cysteine-cluster domain-containing protein [Candidatus Woesearchaeota archaeon]|nr:eight-cysteine-cluster domain-containing protein [Candidatus Woesearchaeota archaeon]